MNSYHVYVSQDCSFCNPTGSFASMSVVSLDHQEISHALAPCHSQSLLPACSCATICLTSANFESPSHQNYSHHLYEMREEPISHPR